MTSVSLDNAVCYGYPRPTSKQNGTHGTHSHRAALRMTTWLPYPLTMQSVMATSDHHPNRTELMALTVTGLHYASQYDFCIHWQCSLSWLPQINTQADWNHGAYSHRAALCMTVWFLYPQTMQFCWGYPRSTSKQIGTELWKESVCWSNVDIKLKVCTISCSTPP